MATKKSNEKIEKIMIQEDLQKRVTHERSKPEGSAPTTRPTTQSQSQSTPPNPQQNTTSKKSE